MPRHASAPIALVLLMCAPLPAATTVDVTAPPYAADPSGVSDCTAAIDRAIADVATAGGGVVRFAAGTYRLACPATTGVPLVQLRSHVTLQGAGATRSVIRLGDDQARDYAALIGGTWIGAPLQDVALLDLGVDANGAGNPVTSPPTGAYPRVMFLCYAGSGVTVRRCRFSGLLGVWALGLDGPDDVVVDQTTIDDVGGGALDFDVSAIYTTGARCAVTGCRIASRGGPGTNAARTAIEIHGSDQTVSGNTISGFRYAANLTGIYPPGVSARQRWQGNHVVGCGSGFVIWSAGGGIADCAITGNDFTLDVDGWRALLASDGFQAIELDIVTQSAAIDGLQITGNTIRYTDYAATTRADDARGSAIELWDYAGTSPVFTNTTIADNAIDHPLACGIDIDHRMRGLAITGNRIIDPGASPAALDPQWRSAIRVRGAIQDCRVQSNVLVDDRAPPRMPVGIWEATDDLGGCVYGGDAVGAGGVAEFAQEPGHGGPAWIQATPPPPAGGGGATSAGAHGGGCGSGGGLAALALGAALTRARRR